MGDTPEQIAEQTLACMTLEHKVGQVYMLGFEGTALTDANRSLIQRLHLGGVTLFARNVDNARQLARLNHELQTVADPVPLFIGVDQEGGRVIRVSDGATVFPGNMAVGASGDAALARRIAEASAQELLAMGVNMDLGPVLDVNTNPLNPVIGVRSFGSRVDLVTRLGVETLRGTQSSGVSAVAKHFPGHGDTGVDSHHDLPVVSHPVARLESLELQPFAAAIRAGVDGIMTAHVYVPAIEPRPDLPATLSSRVVTDLLRHQLGFGGLILTDALDMGAITRGRGAAAASVDAFEAGADLLLIAGITSEDRHQLGTGPVALLAAVRSGRISAARLDASVRRILATKARRGVLPGAVSGAPVPDASVLNSAEHRALALEAARRAVTLHRDEARLLPLHPATTVMVEPNGALRELVGQFAPLTTESADADAIVFGAYDLAQSETQQKHLADLSATGKPVVGVSLRGPYDAAVATRIGTWLTVYGDRPVHLQAAAEALFGKLIPTGRVP
ncbi:MAG TPA: beta-N-acetylhexosaminidase [Chloroflexota bacterium]